MYKIGEEVRVIKKFPVTTYYLKKGVVIEYTDHLVTVKFKECEDTRQGTMLRTGRFFPQPLANAKEFLQLELEGRIE